MPGMLIKYLCNCQIDYLEWRGGGINFGDFSPDFSQNMQIKLKSQRNRG